MKELWKGVLGNENYEISNHGRCRRITAKRGTRIGRILKPTIRNHGYPTYALCKDGVATQILAHRLVVEAFLGEIPNNLQVNHKNGVTTDNNIENLEIVTRSENALHCCHVLGKNIGSKSSNAKLSESDIPIIFDLSNGGLTQREIAAYFHVHQSTVSYILSGHIWSHARLNEVSQ